MSALTLESVVVASRDQVSADLDREVIILGVTDGIYYGVDAVAARIWRLVQQPVTVSAIVAAVVAEFEVDDAQGRADVLAFLAELEQRGLVARVASGA